MDADVVIVGAGPAGSTCARLLADKGHTVTLLDRARFPRDKPCAGWVNVKAFRDFPDLERARRKAGARNRFVEAPLRGLVFLSSDLQQQAVYKPRSIVGYAVSRRRFDNVLLHLAARRGERVRVRQRQEVTAVDVAERGVAVTTSRGRRFEGRILVGADGADSTVARLGGLRETWPAGRRVVCLAREISVEPRTLDRLYGKERRHHVAIGYGGTGGYAWALPKREGVSAGVACRADGAANLDSVFQHWVGDLKRAELLPRRCRAGRPAWAIVPAGAAIEFEGHVGKRTVLIGDAGGFAGAVSGEGVYPAMLSARTAADCISRALGSPHPQDALMEFKFAWRRAFAEYIQMPNANLGLVLPLIYANRELCKRLARCYLFGENF